MASVTHQALLMASSGAVAAVPKGWQRPLATVPSRASIVSRSDASSYANNWLHPIPAVVVPGQFGWGRALSSLAPSIRRDRSQPFWADASSYAGAWLRPPTPPVAGLIGWWDASVFSSLTLATSTVTAMADLSGAGNNLTGSNGPIYGATEFNSSYPGVKFTSTQSEGLINATFPLGTGSTLTVFGTFIMNDPAIDGIGQFARIFSYTANAASHDYDNNGSFTYVRDDTSSNAFFLRNFVGPATAAFGYHTPRRLIITVKSDGTQTVYIDGVATSSAAAAASWVSPGYFGVGRSQFDSSIFSQYGGKMGEAGLATSFSDATVAAALDLYLKNKWGL